VGVNRGILKRFSSMRISETAIWPPGSANWRAAALSRKGQTFIREHSNGLMLLAGPAAAAFVLLTDRYLSPSGQLLYGLAIAPGLLFYLAYKDAEVRAQTTAIVMVAITVEYAGTHVCGWWDYRLHNLPGWVFTGHVGLYLLCLALYEAASPYLPHRMMTIITVGGSGAWMVWGLLFSNQLDTTGIIGLSALLLGLTDPVLGPRIPYIIIVCTLGELAGTAFGLFAYRPEGLIDGLLLGNPPTGVGSGYVFIDSAALLLAPYLLRGWEQCTHWISRLYGPRYPRALRSPKASQPGRLVGNSGPIGSPRVRHTRRDLWRAMETSARRTRRHGTVPAPRPTPDTGQQAQTPHRLTRWHR
jgi:hypothetical protein